LNCGLQNAALASGNLRPNPGGTATGSRTYACNFAAPPTTNPTNDPEPWLKRMQFDLIYSF